jgi:alcohol dehydrogenase (NADP+)
MIKAIGHCAHHSLSNLNPFEFERARSRARRLQIEALFCNACLSHIDQAKNGWSKTVYP